MARRIERRGYRSVWTNEGIGGKESLVQLGIGLAATETLVFASGVANIWARHAATMPAAATLAEAYPGRFVLGGGVSDRPMVEASGQVFGRPLAAQRDYLERMRESSALTLQPATPFPTLVGALGPKMLDLARDHADGAMPANLPVAHTAHARERLGPGKLLVVGVSAARTRRRRRTGAPGLTGSGVDSWVRHRPPRSRGNRATGDAPARRGAGSGYAPRLPDRPLEIPPQRPAEARCQTSCQEVAAAPSALHPFTIE
ncbi:hypothetical protein BA062_17735 [Prauserella flavalba]|uniref:Luciferase-like domain-containing protein n=1 Tax=Prauserella flavalba TaxID=1477506 RepID=A0A318LP94_9PSEU|nr:hypothetical protein BA062_17735 [Prauserella flavalba]